MTATARPKPAPDDGPEPLRMTPRRLADELHRAGEDLARIQLRLHALAPYLDSRPLDVLRERVHECAARAVDVAVAVRVGAAPIVAFGQVRSLPERPLIDAIERRAGEAAIPAADGEPADAPKPKPAARRKREKPPPIAPDRAEDARAPVPAPVPDGPVCLSPEPRMPRAWIARDKEGHRFLGRYVADNLTRAQLHAEQAWPEVPRKRLDVHRAPSGDPDEAEAFHDQFDPGPRKKGVAT